MVIKRVKTGKWMHHKKMRDKEAHLHRCLDLQLNGAVTTRGAISKKSSTYKQCPFSLLDLQKWTASTWVA